MSRVIKIAVIDDSVMVRRVLVSLFARDPVCKVTVTAADPVEALPLMETDWPDVIVLDLEMPRMDGLTFLRKIMSTRPTPVVVCSAFTEKGARITMQALAAGAFSIITKPSQGIQQLVEEGANNLLSAVKAATLANMRSFKAAMTASVPAPFNRTQPLQRRTAEVSDTIVAMGTSTGGTQALQTILTVLPENSPPIVVVQHMPEKFTAAFSERMNSICAIEVREAKHGDAVIPGRALIAPGGHHMQLKRTGAGFIVEIDKSDPVNGHRPSVDVLFKSVAREAQKKALGVIMTGMGDDGARGLLEMHDAGAFTIAQDEATCVVYGMPREAVKRGAADLVLPLNKIAAEILART